MTSFDPNMLVYDPDKMVSQGIWTPDQADKLRNVQRQIGIDAQPVPGMGDQTANDLAAAYGEQPPAATLDAALRQKLPSPGDLAYEAGKAARPFVMGGTAYADPIQAQPQPASTPMAQPQATPQPQLQQPMMAYRGRAPAGGRGGLHGIANEMKRVDQMSRENAAEQERRLGRDFENIQRANEGVADAEAKSASDRAAVFDVGLQAQREQDALDAQARQQEQNVFDQKSRDRDTVKADLAKMSVDPERRWKEKGTAGKVGAAIAIALGALGASLTRGPNYALDIINKSIDDDIDAQLSNINKKSHELDVADRELSDMTNTMGGKDRMRNMMRVQKWEDVLNDMKSQDLSNAPAEIQAHAQQSMAEAQTRYNDAVAKVHSDLVDDVRQNLSSRATVTAQAENSAQGWAQVAIQRAVAGAKSGAGGLSNEQKQHLSETQAALQMLDSPDAKPSALKALLTKYVPFVQTEAKMYDQARDAKAQVVGRGIQHGATTADEQRVWADQLPESTDSEATKDAKKGRLRQLLMQQVSAITGEPLPQQANAQAAAKWR